MAEVREGCPDCLENTARGFRDIYWCWINNEPGFPTYGGGSDGKHVCSECGYAIEELEDQHTFIAHVKKPKG